MVLRKITRVINVMSNSNGYYHNQRMPIHFKLTVVLVDFVQSAPKEEPYLDQAVNQRNSESRDFRVIHFESSITT